METRLPTATADAGPSVRIHVPREELRSYVTFFYFVETAGPLDDFLYPEWGNVRFGTGGQWYFRGEHYPEEPVGDWLLFGPTDRAARIVSDGGSTAGFGLTPLGWERLIDVPADALVNRVGEPGDLLGMPLAAVHREVCGHGSDVQSVALFERLLIDRLALRPPNSDLAILTDRVLRERPADVTAFAAAAGMSRKVLSRVCRQVFGFGPKRLLRRQRFLDTLGTIRITDQPSFATLIDPDYFDQSHFNREFREFMGLSPRAYLSAPRPLMAEAARAQVEAGVTLSFKLPNQPG